MSGVKYPSRCHNRGSGPVRFGSPNRRRKTWSRSSGVGCKVIGGTRNSLTTKSANSDNIRKVALDPPEIEATYEKSRDGNGTRNREGVRVVVSTEYRRPKID